MNTVLSSSNPIPTRSSTFMKLKYILIAFAFLSITALARTETTTSPAPQAFESSGRVQTKMFVPADLMTGIALRTRIREIYAIDKLREMSKTEEFTKAIANAGQQKIEGVVGIVTNPVGTVQNIPLGASRFFGRIGERLKYGRDEDQRSRLQNVSGVSKAKSALAAKLGVSPYSFNQELQKQLTLNARAMAMGGLVVKAATAVGGPAGDVLMGLNVNQALQP